MKPRYAIKTVFENYLEFEIIINPFRRFVKSGAMDAQPVQFEGFLQEPIGIYPTDPPFRPPYVSCHWNLSNGIFSNMAISRETACLYWIFSNQGPCFA